MSVPWQPSTYKTDDSRTPVYPRPVNRLAIIQWEFEVLRLEIMDPLAADAKMRDYLHRLNRRVLTDVPGIVWGENNRLSQLTESFSVRRLGNEGRLAAFLSAVYWTYHEQCGDYWKPLSTMSSKSRAVCEAIRQFVYSREFFSSVVPSQKEQINEWWKLYFPS